MEAFLKYWGYDKLLGRARGIADPKHQSTWAASTLPLKTDDSMIQMVSPTRKPISASLRSPPWGNDPRRQAAGFQAKTTRGDLEQCLVEAEELRVASLAKLDIDGYPWYTCKNWNKSLGHNRLNAWIPHNSCTMQPFHIFIFHWTIAMPRMLTQIMIQFTIRKGRLKSTGQGSTRVTYRHCQPET